MKITNRVFTRENGKWVLSRKEEIEFNFIRWKLDFHFLIGIGYFTAYEDEKYFGKKIYNSILQHNRSI